MNKDQALALAKARMRMQSHERATADTTQWQSQIKDDLTGNMSFGDQVSSGAGRYMTNIGRGAKQMVGMGPSGQEVAEQRRLDAPLASTGGGKLGELTAAVTLAAPSMLLPGANTLAGAGVLGAAQSMLQPTESTGERLVAGGAGFASGAAGQKIANVIGNRVPAAQPTPREELLKESTQAGFVVPPATAKPNFLNNIIESIGGKSATAQQASVKNQELRNKLAAQALELPRGTSISEGAVSQVRARGGQAYADVADLSPQAAADLEALKQARFNMNDYRRFFNRSGDPSARSTAEGFSSEAGQLEKSIEAAAQQAGRPELIEALKKSRALIAKSHDVGGALDAAGNVSGKDLAALLDRKKLTGELGLSARFAQNFPKANQDVANIGSPGVSALTPWMGAAMGMGGYDMGGPEGAMLGLAPFARYGVRSALLSKPYQSMVNNPPNTQALAEALKKGLPPAAIALPSLQAQQ